VQKYYVFSSQGCIRTLCTLCDVPPALKLAYVHQFGHFSLHIISSGQCIVNIFVMHFHVTATDLQSFNPLKGRGNYSVTSNNMNLVHWPLMGGLLHLVQRGGD